MRNVFLLLALSLDLVNSYAIGQRGSERRTRQAQGKNEKRIVCYYSSWAIYRDGDTKFTPEYINPHLCTHLIYAFAIVDDGDIKPKQPEIAFEEEGFAKFTKLKKYNESLKVILSLGGTKEGPTRFSNLVSDEWRRKTFPRNARVFLQKYNFDGLDIDWHSPGGPNLGSKSSDKDNFVELIKGLKENFKEEFHLSITIPKYGSLVEKGYDIHRLAQYLNFMNVLTYDYHNPTDAYVHHVSPLYSISESDKNDNVDATIRYYIEQGVDPGMLNMGIPLYGITFMLEDPSKTDIGSKTADEGLGQRDKRGETYFVEFCEKFRSRNWTIKHVNKTAMGPYAYRGDQWMSFDDEDMVKTKARYAASKNLGGIMFWSVDMDDFNGRCHNRTYPMIRGAKEAFLAKPSNESSTTAPDAATSTTSISTETKPIPQDEATSKTPTSTETKLLMSDKTTPKTSRSTETKPIPPEATTPKTTRSTTTVPTNPTIIPSPAAKRSPTGISIPIRSSTSVPREFNVTATLLPSVLPAATTSNPLNTHIFPKPEGKSYHSNRDINFFNEQKNVYVSLDINNGCLLLDKNYMPLTGKNKIVLTIVSTE